MYEFTADPCPACKPDTVCKTPSCGRLKGKRQEPVIENKQAEPVADHSGLIKRIDAAIERVTQGRGLMSIPADPRSDVDLVLSECKALLQGENPPFWATEFYPAPAVMQEPVHFRAVICKEQQEQALGVVPKIVGFVDKKAAEQFILEKRDFQGWRYNLEPLYTEAPAVAVNEQLLEALKELMYARTDKAEGMADAAIAQAEAAKGGVV